jgi:hypothetical protein
MTVLRLLPRASLTPMAAEIALLPSVAATIADTALVIRIKCSRSVLPSLCETCPRLSSTLGR